MTPPSPTGPILVSSFVARDREAELADIVGAAGNGSGLRIVTPDAAEASTAQAVFLSPEAVDTGELREMARALSASEALAWVHVGWAGIDHPWFTSIAARGVTLTSSSGAGATAVAHHAIAGMLAVVRGLHRSVHAQAERRWEAFTTRDIDDLRVVVVGMGPIGVEIARLAQALGADVLGVRRTPQGDEPCETWPLDRLDDAVRRADVLVLGLPLTADTRHVIDERRLALLPDGAFIVNIGRGGLVDEAAMIDALAGGRVAGAALDVTDTEPLPDDSPLWSMPTVLLTPHIAGRTAGTGRRATDAFLENLRRWVAGQDLRNVVEAERLVPADPR